jgi:biopolymer transport protein ExbB/TolQ
MADPNKGGGGLAQVSAGIAEALLTTAVGLAVAIVSVWFYNFFTTNVDDFTVDIDETAGEVLDGMNREGRGPAGAAMARPITPQQPQRW